VKLYTFSIQFFDDVARFPFYFEGEKLEKPFCALSSRALGNVLELSEGTYPIREAFYKSCGYNQNQCYACTQIHSKRVILVDKNTSNNYPEGDGLLTRDSELALSVTVADCLPIFLYDTKTNAIGILHSGWKGTGIVKIALEKMKQSFGTEAKNIAALLGPCIQVCCYQVDEERANLFEAEFGSLKSSYPLGTVINKMKTADENQLLCYLNLQAANAALLEEAGVEHLAYTKDCTFTDNRFGSFRREGKAYTRMAALVRMKK
jgi:YfiH family protein